MWYVATCVETELTVARKPDASTFSTATKAAEAVESATGRTCLYDMNSRADYPELPPFALNGARKEKTGVSSGMC